MTDHSVDGRPPATRAPRGPKPVTAARLENKALHYLEKFASSAANLRRVLMRAVDRSARAHGTDREQGLRWVEDLIARYQRSGLLNDAAYAEARTASLRRQGRSARAIQARLVAKGVAASEIAKALAGEDEDAGRAELAAAVAFARRRRLGAFRPEAERALRRDRDMAALARAGFAIAVARRVIEADQPLLLLEEDAG